MIINPFPKGQILDSSKLKELADDNFKLDENGGKFSNMVENTRYEEFFLFPQCFQKFLKASFPRSLKVRIVG